MARRAGLSPRKRPAQARSRQTVEDILEAAARVFAERGYADGTTNRIARRAGVSIGSLYEYFPNKDAIFVALLERHLERGMGEVAALLAEERGHGESIEALLRRLVEALRAFHARQPDLHRVLFEEAPHPPEAHACVLRGEAALAHALEARLRALGGVRVRDVDAAAHLVVQTAEALTHHYVVHGLHALGDTAFVEEVVTMLAAYLRARPR